MIRFNRKDTEKARKAIIDLEKAKVSGGSYNTPDVNAALAEMFLGKCYICENKEGISSFQIEHLKPHGENAELKYDWNNLFWSCAHCNNIKNAKYDPILDCSQIDVDRKIAFRKEGYFGTKEKFVFDALADDNETQNTVALLNEVYYGNTPQKKLEAANIRQRLRKDLSDFKNLVRDYYDAEAYDKEDIRMRIRKEVGQGSPFTAFKRWILWDNKEEFYELIEYCDLA